VKIDNFALTMHQTCPAKYDLRIRQNWTSRGKSAALGFGGALHSGMAHWYKTHDLGQALLAIAGGWNEDVPVDDWRTKEKCITTMIEYSKMYPAESFQVVGLVDGNPMIEVPFTIEMDGLRVPFCGRWVDVFGEEHPGCGYMVRDFTATVCPQCGAPLEPIEYGGIFDGLIEFSGQVYILEHKSTSVLGSTYFNQFKPNNQVCGYIWAAGKLSGKKVVGALVNAIGVYKASATKFEREITSRSETALLEWKKNVQSTCAEIRFHEHHEFWPMRTMACTLYGRCEFLDVHVLEHQAEREKRLENDFIRETWDYELREA
jgi:hypothetical protein